MFDSWYFRTATPALVVKTMHGMVCRNVRLLVRATRYRSVEGISLIVFTQVNKSDQILFIFNLK